MATSMNRRQWLKTSALATSGLFISSSFPGCKKKEILSKSPHQDKVIKLNSNESPYGISPKAKEAHLAALDRAHLYPHREYYQSIHPFSGHPGN